MSAQDRVQIRTLGAPLVWESPPSSHQFLGCGGSGGPRACSQVWLWWTDPGRVTLKVGLGCSGCWGPTRQPRCPAGREPRCTDRKRVRQGPGEEGEAGRGPQPLVPEASWLGSLITEKGLFWAGDGPGPRGVEAVVTALPCSQVSPLALAHVSAALRLPQPASARSQTLPADTSLGMELCEQ